MAIIEHITSIIIGVREIIIFLPFRRYYLVGYFVVILLYVFLQTANKWGKKIKSA